MSGRGIQLAAIKLDDVVWFDLSHHGKKHVVRFVTLHNQRRVKDPSDHRLQEITVEGSVKWRPKDSSTINIIDIPPLGARKT